MSRLILLLSSFVVSCSGHGSMLEPPSRASMWKFGFPTPADYQHTQAFCGGFYVQHQLNGGKCGICGDPWNEKPRQHEAPGGKFASGILTQSYRPGQVIDVTIDLTANHKGYFTFKLCSNNNTASDPDQSCFEDLLLEDGRSRLDVDNKIGKIIARLQLPWIWCSQCILQWTYKTGNNWGWCEDGTGELGCGPQETFRACADVSIVGNPVDGKNTTSSFPTTTTSTTSSTNITSTTSTSLPTTDTTTSTPLPTTTSTPLPTTTSTPLPTTTSTPLPTTTSTPLPTTTSTPLPTTDTQLPPLDCVAVGPWAGSSEVGEWCQLNCHYTPQPNCPVEICKCGQEP